MSVVALGALTGALVAGVLVGERLGPGPAGAGLALAALVGLVVAATPRGRLALAMLALALIGAALMQRALDGLVDSPLAELVVGRDAVVARATLVEDPGGRPYRVEALVRVVEVAPKGAAAQPAGDRTVLLTADGATAARIRLLHAGDEVTVAGWLSPLRDFERHLRWRHAVGRLDARELLAFSGPSSWLWRTANRLRELVLAGGTALPPTERALLAGFLLGDTRGVPPSVEARFRAAGLTHLVAVSGANVAFVLALAAPALSRLGLRTRLAGALAVLALFGTMTRWEPSVLRATAMAGAAMVAVVLGRPAGGLRVLLLAVGVLVAADPFLVHSVGFLLSCAASAGILALGSGIGRALPGPRWVREALGVTAAAQVGVAPVMIPTFGSMPLAALPANLLVAPVVGPLTAGGLVAGVAGGILRPWWPGAAAGLALPVGLLVRWVILVAELTAPIPATIDARAACASIAVGALAAAAVRLRRGNRHGRGHRVPSPRPVRAYAPPRCPDSGSVRAP